MSFAARAVYGAQKFTKLFVDTLAKLKRPSDHARITRVLRGELQWWIQFAPLVNGLCSCLMGQPWNDVKFYTDASFKGFVADGGTSGWLAGTWHESVHTFPATFHQNRVRFPNLANLVKSNINLLDLIAACLPLRIWGPTYTGSRSIILLDNTQTVAFLRATTKIQRHLPG